MKKWLKYIILTVIFIGLGTMVILLSYDKSVKEETPPITADESSLEIVIPVVGRVVKPIDFSETVRASGVLEGWMRTTISSEAGGRVKRWNIEIGQLLDADQSLLKLDDELIAIQLRQAESVFMTAQSAREKAKSDLERINNLHTKGSASQNDLENARLGLLSAEANFTGAEAGFALAQRMFRETEVKIPFEGRLVKRMVEVGQTVAPGMPLAEVVQDDPLKLTLALTEEHIAKVKVNQIVRIQSPLFNQTFTGRVHAISAAADLMSRMFAVEIRIDQKEGVLKPGMAVSAEIIVNTLRNALTIPIDASLNKGNDHFCFITQGDRAVQKEIELYLTQENIGVVTSGLVAGDTLITVGYSGLKDGQKINLTIDSDG